MITSHKSDRNDKCNRRSQLRSQCRSADSMVMERVNKSLEHIIQRCYGSLSMFYLSASVYVSRTYQPPPSIYRCWYLHTIWLYRDRIKTCLCVCTHIYSMCLPMCVCAWTCVCVCVCLCVFVFYCFHQIMTPPVSDSFYKGPYHWVEIPTLQPLQPWD